MTRTVSGAHYGVRDWLVQRISAVFMALYTLVLAMLVWDRQPMDYAAWRALFEPAVMRHATVLFAMSLYWHAWIGVRDIFMDYLKPTGWRLAAQAVVVLLLLLYVLWTVNVLWRLT